MDHWRRGPATLAGLALVVTALTAAAAVTPIRAEAAAGDHVFAVIGDTPYGAAALAALPRQIAQLNADPAVQWVDHLGDIKDGTTACTDSYLATIKADFDRFQDPLVYTLGDNEWADCPRPASGSYDPLARLAAVRKVFFPVPGRTLGVHPAAVTSQAGLGLPENVAWTRAGVDFAAVDVVGSDNDLAPWTGRTAPTAAQSAEEKARTAAAVEELDDAFADARTAGRRAVVVLMQADMFARAAGDPATRFRTAFSPVVAAIARGAAAFGGPVYLFNGDSHRYVSNRPLATGSAWVSFYRLTAAVPNLTRVTVDGAAKATDYLRVTVHATGSPVLTWTRVPLRP